MTDMQTFMWMITFVEFFIIGMWFGGAMAQRDNPNEPKPKDWDDKLHKEWRRGYRAGERSTIKRMSSKLRDEELIAEYNSEHRRGDAE